MVHEIITQIICRGIIHVIVIAILAAQIIHKAMFYVVVIDAFVTNRKSTQRKSA